MSKKNKAELIEVAKDFGYFNNEATKVMYARENGHFYYKKPPVFADGFKTFEIKKKEVEDVEEAEIEAAIKKEEQAKKRKK